ncbi:AAA family ATPase [Nitratireductor aquibiodomus]|uniref:AAA family ATPase n=1 Tax=Nitratireductor aquibiodomus TaxID=204799 RepID=UPI0019D3FB34|nr:AAA family ATPase [Nitratireductor aquibiodomus]MBN7759981.1 AAA family ATPase [Nitratireductor aquibiodomus]
MAAIKRSSRLDVTDLALEFQNAIIAANKKPDDFAEILTAATARFEGGVQEVVDRRVAHRLRFMEPANDNEEINPPALISSGDFVRGFVPPDYLLDGVIQSGFLYSITGQTGSGKTAVALLLCACVALGISFAGRETKRGRVFYFAGENPDDVKMRWIGLCHELGLNPDEVDVHFVEGVFSIEEFAGHIDEKAEALGGVSLVVIDTTAAYFLGEDENSNTQMGAYARLLRKLTRLPGAPTILTASHPVKAAQADNLLPRGGGAFLNEMDGNLSLSSSAEKVSTMGWQGKFRGPDFGKMTFDLKTITVPTLVDKRGRQIPTVMAHPVGEAEVAMRAGVKERDDELMLLAIRQDGRRSLSDLADALGWCDQDGAPDKGRADNATARLKRRDLVVYELRTWKLTRKGQTAATDAAGEMHERKTNEHRAAKIVASAARKRRK